MKEFGFVFRSDLKASPERVWDRIVTIAGVNDELRPFMRMTHPKGLDRLPDDVPTGVRLFRSWILLFGVIPIDYADLTLVRVDPGKGFHEQSRLATARRWEHERTIEPSAGGCVLTDRIHFEPRLAALGPVLLRVTRALFAHRHRRLRSRFGGRAMGGSM